MGELFPRFFMLGKLSQRSPRFNRLILYASLLLWMSGQFVLWGWVG